VQNVRSEPSGVQSVLADCYVVHSGSSNAKYGFSGNHVWSPWCSDHSCELQLQLVAVQN
jgi:hypothetical protein